MPRRHLCRLVWMRGGSVWSDSCCSMIGPIVLVLTHGTRSASAVRASAFAAALGGFMAQGLYDYLFYEIAFVVFILLMVWGTIHALSVDEEAETPSRSRDLCCSGSARVTCAASEAFA